MRKHTPMSIKNRAKQFLPFAALKGLPEALAAVEAAMEHTGETQYASADIPASVGSDLAACDDSTAYCDFADCNDICNDAFDYIYDDTDGSNDDAYDNADDYARSDAADGDCDSSSTDNDI